MGCKTVHLDGGSAIVCSRGRRQKCSVGLCTRDSVALCDYPVQRKGKPGVPCTGIRYREQSIRIGARGIGIMNSGETWKTNG